MNFRFALVLALFLSGLCRVLAQTPEEKYLAVYVQMKEADALADRGQFADATKRYTEAQTALRHLQTVHPAWNDKIVNYRLDYIATRLQVLSQKGVPAPPPTAPAVPGAITAPAVPPAAPQPVAPSAPVAPVVAAPPPPVFTTPPPVVDTTQLRALEAEVAQLQSQKSLLEARLREALSVQPATLDPGLLARAEEKARMLEKERDLLRVALEQERARAPIAPPPVQPSPAQEAAMTDLRQKLAEQTDLAASLRNENEQLRGRLVAMPTPAPAPVAPVAPVSGDVSRELLEARIALANLQATNSSLLSERVLLQQRIADLSRNNVSRDNYRAIEKERDELRKKLLTAEKRLAKYTKKGAKIPVAEEEQLQAALAKLQVYESQAVPYTPDELALFRSPDTQMTLAQTNAVRRRAREIPSGASSLVAEARRAAEAGRLEEAEKKLQDVLRQDERNLYVLTMLAGCQIDLKRYAEAEASINRALAVDAQAPDVLFVLGQLRYMQERYDESLDALSLAAKLVPEDARTQYFLGKVLVQKGNRPAAETALRKAVQLLPGWGEAHYSLALIYATQQPPFKELAAWHYRKARDDNYPANPEFEKLLERK